MVSATRSGVVPKAFSRSAVTGRSLAATISRRIAQHRVAPRLVVRLGEREREARAGRGERLEAGLRQQTRRARVPGVRHDERTRARVQRPERRAPLGLTRHVPFLEMLREEPEHAAPRVLGGDGVVARAHLRALAERAPSAHCRGRS